MAFNATTTMEVEECCNCGVSFGMPASLHRQRMAVLVWIGVLG